MSKFKFNVKTAGLALGSLVLMVLTKVVDDKTRQEELAELREEITRDVTNRVSKNGEES